MRTDPFHEGEIAVQQRAGERGTARRNGAVISSRIVPGALSFLARQRLVALSAVGDDGQLWTSVWCGAPGFMESADGRRLRIRRSSITVSPDDPVLHRLAVGRELGMLAIELVARRRLRIGGVVDALSKDEIEVVVRESVPNCPKYIQQRRPHEISAAAPIGTAAGRTLDVERRRLIERADTAFVGSLHPTRGVDASHRGGAPGFIHVVDAATLRVPDYPGNGMFMTLGNFEVDSRASMTVLDFERGTLLCLSGSAALRFDGEHASHPTGGTGRYWDFTVREWVQFEQSSLRWDLLAASPFNPRTDGK